MLLFINTLQLQYKPLLCIQIHLMLLFITEHIRGNGLSRYSNTSHVIVYHHTSLTNIWLSVIQIHLMLLFITITGAIWAERRDSNTSHVIVYRKYFFPAHTVRTIQIHLMLLFICIGIQAAKCWYLFKYISCYCLSLYKINYTNGFWIQIHLMLLFIEYVYFVRNFWSHSNTSHVIVYHLSLMPNGLYLLFKYISCYCLSRCSRWNSGNTQIQIHLMLLFIEHNRSCNKNKSIIQIHLMLLFIKST